MLMPLIPQGDGTVAGVWACSLWRGLMSAKSLFFGDAARKANATAHGGLLRRRPADSIPHPLATGGRHERSSVSCFGNPCCDDAQEEERRKRESVMVNKDDCGSCGLGVLLDLF